MILVMYNPTTGYMTETRDITWLHHVYYGKPEAREEVVLYLQIELPFQPEDAEARKGVTLKASEPKIKSKDDEKKWSTVHMRSGKVVKPPVLYMKEYCSDGEEGVLNAILQNYYAPLCMLDDKKIKNIEIIAVGTGLGGRFHHTSKLKC